MISTHYISRYLQQILEGEVYTTVSALPKLTIITAQRYNINFVPMKLAGICVSVSQATGHY